MRELDKKELIELKRKYFTPAQKTLCKKFEQCGGEFIFNINEKKYILRYKSSKAYTNYIESKQKYNTGILHKGNQVRNMDKYHKFNHEEYKLHKKIDKKQWTIQRN